MPENKYLRIGAYLIGFAACVLLLWLMLRFALPWLLPFLLAFLIARLIEPVVVFLTQRLRFKRVIASGLCTVITAAILVTLVSFAAGRAMYEVSAFVKELPGLLSEMSGTFSSVEDKIYGYVTAAPPAVQEYLRDAIKNFAGKSAELPASLSGHVLSFLSSVLAQTPKIILFIVTTGISVFFISSGYRQVTDFILRQIPEKNHRAMREFKSGLVSTFGKWLKAQLMLCGITFVELALSFCLMKIDYAVLLALLVAFIDALPIFGTGTVLIPWSIFSLISGNLNRAAWVIGTYAVVTLIRSCVEPKLVGAQLGLHPVATLIVMYVGFCSFGVCGMILFPILLILLKQLNDKGYIKLWR